VKTISRLHLRRFTVWDYDGRDRYWMLRHLIIRSQGPDSLLLNAVGHDWNGNSLFYIAAIAAAFWSQ
jgi:hypothetical protein